MKNQLKQLIPGNPGTSFVVALLYTIQQKYHETIKNSEQLSLFTQGIIKSRNVFFSGVINEFAFRFNKQIFFLSNNKYILKLAEPEINKDKIAISFNELNKEEIKKLLDQYQFIVFSVDIFAFRKYHDYHFVCISRKNNFYEVFEPKSGKVTTMNESEIGKLVSSITTGLKDILMCFVV